MELGDTWVYGMQASQALFGAPQPLSFSFDDTNSTPGLTVNKVGIATFTWNSATAGLNVGDQVFIDLVKLLAVVKSDRQRCLVTVVAPGTTKTAIGKLDQGGSTMRILVHTYFTLFMLAFTGCMSEGGSNQNAQVLAADGDGSYRIVYLPTGRIIPSNGVFDPP